MIIQIEDNIPLVSKGKYGVRARAECEFCGSKHMMADKLCHPIIDSKNGNEFEHCKEITMNDINEALEHQRILIFGVTFDEELDSDEKALRANFEKILDADAFFASDGSKKQNGEKVK